MFEGFDHLIAGALARQAGLQQVIAALHAVVVEADKFRDRRMRLAGGDRGGDRGGGRMLVQRVADRHDRGLVAAAHARRAHDAHISAEPALEIAQQGHRAGELAAEAVADPHRQRRRRFLVVHDDVEMGVERGDLVDLDEGQPHLLGERRQMARIEAAEMVLQQVQVLDQQIAPPLAVAEQCLDLVQGRRIDLPALRMIEARAAAPSPDGCGGRAL